MRNGSNRQRTGRTSVSTPPRSTCSRKRISSWRLPKSNSSKLDAGGTVAVTFLSPPDEIWRPDRAAIRGMKYCTSTRYQHS